jgi:hypothetical protein
MSEPAAQALAQAIERIQASAGNLRELFWQNAVRELLTGLSAQIMAAGAPMDGRVGIMLHDGTRVAIGEVAPAFACGIPGDPITQALSVAVECSVFRVTTPQGEVLILPLSSIRGIHTLSGELLKELEQQAMREGGSPMGQPFGFAAFTSAARAAASEPEAPASPTPPRRAPAKPAPRPAPRRRRR